MRKSLLVIGAASLLLAASAHAQNNVGVSLGTTGVGVHLSMPVQEKLHARVGFNGLTYSYDTSTDDADYDFDLKLRTADLLLDWFPRSSGFRVTGGIVYNGNELSGTADPSDSGTYTFGDTTYSVDDVGIVEGDITFRKAAPYLGIGWANTRPDSKWSFTADLGVLFQGSPRTRLETTGCNAPELLCTQFANDVEAEHRRLRDEIDDFKYYPVARIGLSYRF